MSASDTSPQAAGGLDQLRFVNRFTAQLPADPDERVWPRGVLGACFSRVRPKEPAAPRRVAYVSEVAEILGLSRATCESEPFRDVMSGKHVLEGMDPFAMCYGGHQFGNWAGQLGDGRAINLGEVANASGEHWTLQLKGAGPTPYSRHADGLAVLRSSVREFLCSEAMYHLGVPTTRALSLVLTGDAVTRDMFYDGNAKDEPGAIVCRVARSFIRFGNFEILASRGDTDLLRKLAAFTVRSHFPELVPAALKDAGELPSDVYLEWFREVSRRTAAMTVEWMRVGFVHGVMNTDNMSILGETIDYGPYGWLEDYDPNWTPNTTDAQGRRYRFGAQPEVAHWNLSRLASAIVPLVESVEPLQEAMGVYAEAFAEGWKNMFAAKLGLRRAASSEAADEELGNELLEVLQLAETDMTLFFRGLAEMSSDAPAGAGDIPEALLGAYYVPEQLTTEVRTRTCAWLERYRERVRADGASDADRRERMNAVNPLYVLRNYLAQLAIDAAEKDDFSMITELLEVLRRPYTEQAGKERFSEKRPDWARERAGCSMLSCSS